MYFMAKKVKLSADTNKRAKSAIKKTFLLHLIILTAILTFNFSNNLSAY